MENPEWYTSLAWVTQMAHLFSGWASVLTVDLFAKRAWMPHLLLQLWAIPKEFIWDIIVEQDTWEGGLLDWSMYTLGGLIAWGVLWLRKEQLVSPLTGGRLYYVQADRLKPMPYPDQEKK